MMFSSDRYVPRHFAETMKGTCSYCHRRPARWYQVGHEKVCVYCGTRVTNLAAAQPRPQVESSDSER